jgi:hypothetical protein
VPSQQPQGQLQTQHSVDTNNYDMDNHNIKSETSYRQEQEEIITITTIIICVTFKIDGSKNFELVYDSIL